MFSCLLMLERSIVLNSCNKLLLQIHYISNIYKFRLCCVAWDEPGNLLTQCYGQLMLHVVLVFYVRPLWNCLGSFIHTGILLPWTHLCLATIWVAAGAIRIQIKGLSWKPRSVSNVHPRSHQVFLFAMAGNTFSERLWLCCGRIVEYHYHMEKVK